MSKTFIPGQRVGILTGLQAVGGPTIGQHGFVLRAEEYWEGVTEYVVKVDGEPTPLVFRPYLLVAA